jgi:predicted amidohydrolase YtcJ
MSGEISAATVYVNGRVLTMEAGDPTYEVLGVRDGRGAVEVDLRGAALMPGIVDTHPHVIHFGLIEGPCVDIKDAVSHDDIVSRIAARAATVPKGEVNGCCPISCP